MDKAMQRKSGAGWLLGFNNLFVKEIREWLEVRRWLVQTIVWLFIVNGLLAMILFVLPNVASAGGETAIQDPVSDGVIGFFGLGGLAFSIGIIILAQGEIVGEKLNGTAEWVLSKPVARSAFFLSKLAANAIGALVVMLLIQSVIAYGILTAADADGVTLLNFLAGLGMLALHLCFYLSLTLMMGVLAKSREMVLGVSLGVLLVGLLVRNFLGTLTLVAPWMLPDLAGLAALGETAPLPILLPVVSTAVWTLIFITVGLWRFEKLEF